jgi:hypothetical protein
MPGPVTAEGADFLHGPLSLILDQIVEGCHYKATGRNCFGAGSRSV